MRGRDLGCSQRLTDCGFILSSLRMNARDCLLSCIWLCCLDLRCHLATEEISNGASDFLMVGFEREVAGVVETRKTSGYPASKYA